jgi:hypothetical protein
VLERPSSMRHKIEASYVCTGSGKNVDCVASD